MTSKDERNSESSADPADDSKGTTSTFEQTDANPRAIAWAAVGLLVLLVLSSLIVGGVRHFFSPSGPTYRSATAAQKHLFEQRAPLKQASPGVEIQPAKKLEKVRQVETQKLSEYMWTDSNQRFARIPIERAVEIIAAENKSSDATGEEQ